VDAPAEANAPILSTISAGVPARPPARRLATSRPIAAARRASSAVSFPQQTTWAALNAIDDAARPACSQASRTRPNSASDSAGDWKFTLNSSA
jgi:hypothetical protein